MTARDDVGKLHAPRFVEYFEGQDERSLTYGTRRMARVSEDRICADLCILSL